MVTPALELQAKSFKALSHPSRLAILEMMRRQPICSCEIEPALGLSQSNIAKHLAILRESRLVRSWRDGSRVMCEVADPRIFEIMDMMRGVTLDQLEVATKSFAMAGEDFVE